MQKIVNKNPGKPILSFQNALIGNQKSSGDIIRSKAIYTTQWDSSLHFISLGMTSRQIIQFIIFSFFIVCCKSSITDSPSSKLTELPVLEVRISPENLQTMRSNKTINTEFPAQIAYKGKNFDGWLRPSGARSRTFPRWSYRMRLPDSKEIEGLYIFNLSAQVHDPTMLYTTIATHLYKQAGFPVFQNKHAFLRLNKQDKGLYPMLEKIDPDFFVKRHLPVAELYKSGSQITFSFEGEEFHPKLSFDKKIPDDKNYESIVEFFNAVDTSSISKIETSLGTFLNIDQYLSYHAMTTLINNTDAFRNNFFLWKEEANSPFKFVPWDFDLSFNRKWHVGLYGKNAVIKKLLLNENTFNLYKKKLQIFTEQFYTEDNIFPLIDSTVAIIRDGYDIDPHLGNGIYNLDEQVNKLKDFISNRRQFVIAELDSFKFNGMPK
ncbi:MAG: hypothetical protein D8M58_10505 [Calditrichaeota bacterium]|nr:MAG: hypothetical protein DWQ03_09880 [Calditrichota bacterium]MBL1205821.1 hypothetical protein [Calditrichota bacterium]NOG45648.1 hypothetical protein [Calditrichota bacterium]